MGMYTELLLKVEVKDGLPEEVEDVLNFLFNREDHSYPAVLPDHKFFRAPRWPAIGSCSSHYHIPWSNSMYSGHYIFSRSDLKNYDDEIELFLDWVTPYLATYKGVCYGWTWYEEEDAPTLLFPEEN